MYSKCDIEEKARKEIVRADVEGIVPVPLDRIARALGYEPYKFEGSGDVSGLVDYENKRIYINGNESPQRQRFTLAHEIGHAVLHPGQRIVDYRRNIDAPNTPVEREANQFASELIMPRERFKSAWRERGGNVYRVAAYFGVSHAAASIRAKDLGMELP
ncbi:ImmA/IrrE family metallo-endopeptidase [Luteolibacter yonseiensis]|uniref:ImmA/IrrE family metallo-endopeptidase n=1 Tax=Luteolibacter yonseiensis TaxID=1144680 RepID=A0A934R9J5_9BACT|nr:ImmA/IrrE family metallo-endopeptidase [Luteolibacter yonseiensis]MBK1817534.1 ImmA/IrrE family metallo-endopeptidase [Luteolibacter yonseiensis]